MDIRSHCVGKHRPIKTLEMRVELIIVENATCLHNFA
jgi:hypothetical protein